MLNTYCIVFTYMKISCAIPHYNNARFMHDTLNLLVNDVRICEIIICDDVSTDLCELKNIITNIPNSYKIKLYENKTNLGVYYNKLKSISKCTSEWAILLDSDNILGDNYIDKLYSIYPWNNNYIYAPDQPVTFPGQPSTNMDYRFMSDKTINRSQYIHNFNNMRFQCLINTCNYFVPVTRYNKCHSDKNYDRDIIDSLDSAVLFTDWICSGYFVKVIKGLTYHHRLHPQSNYTISKARKHEIIVKKQLFEKIQSVKMQRLGTIYGGWIIPCHVSLQEDSVVYSVGMGEDISFDLAIQHAYKCPVHMIDPTDRAHRHFSEVCEYYKKDKGEWKFSGDIQPDYEEHIASLNIDTTKLNHIPLGVWETSGRLPFYKQTNDKYVSQTLIPDMFSKSFDMVDVKTIKDIMRQNEHTYIDLLKMDIEGAEVKVLNNMLDSQIYPRYLCIEFDLKLKNKDSGETGLIINRLINVGYIILVNDDLNITFEYSN